MFQRRNPPVKRDHSPGAKGASRPKRDLNMYDYEDDEGLIDHSESDEAINNDNPNFEGNEFGPRRGGGRRKRA